MKNVLQNLYPYDPQKPMRTQEAFEYCAKLASTHYENFTVGSYLVPKDIRPHIYSVYAFCRWSDDLGDEIGDSQKSYEFLDLWSKELESCYGGNPTHPVFIALKETIKRFDLPIQPFQDLIKAFKMDQVVNRYQNLNELLYYCKHSANPVGRIFLMLFGYRDEERFDLADATCTALQITNFLQDIAIDLTKGRIYIPLEDMDFFNYTESDLISKKVNSTFIELMKFEINRTREIFSKGLKLVKKVEGRVQLDIELFSRGGLQILKFIEKNQYDVFNKRPILSKFSKGILAGGTTLRFLGRKLLPKSGIGNV
jgi:squalene synthase HpnC